MDTIFLKELTVEAVIGIFDWEREIRQTIAIDLELTLDLRPAARSDSIHDAVDYKVVAGRVLEFVQESRFRLVETLAAEEARLVLREFPVGHVRVAVHKPGAIRFLKDVGVRIERSRASLGDA